jgi:hypothetical protein
VRCSTLSIHARPRTTLKWRLGHGVRPCQEDAWKVNGAKHYTMLAAPPSGNGHVQFRTIHSAFGNWDGGQSTKTRPLMLVMHNADVRASPAEVTCRAATLEARSLRFGP